MTLFLLLINLRFSTSILVAQGYAAHSSSEAKSAKRRKQIWFTCALVWRYFDFIDFTKLDTVYKQNEATFLRVQILLGLNFNH